MAIGLFIAVAYFFVTLVGGGTMRALDKYSKMAYDEEQAALKAKAKMKLKTLKTNHKIAVAASDQLAAPYIFYHAFTLVF